MNVRELSQDEAQSFWKLGERWDRARYRIEFIHKHIRLREDHPAHQFAPLPEFPVPVTKESIPSWHGNGSRNIDEFARLVFEIEQKANRLDRAFEAQNLLAHDYDQTPMFSQMLARIASVESRLDNLEASK
jgi:hypothetical protein